MADQLSAEEAAYMLDVFSAVMEDTPRRTFDDREAFGALVRAYVVLGRKLAERSPVPVGDDLTAELVAGTAEGVRAIRNHVIR